MPSLAYILVLLLVVGLAVMFGTKWGRVLFDVAVFLTLLLILLRIV